MISILIILLLSVFTPLRSNKKFQEKSNFLSNKQIYIFLTLVLLSLLVLTGFFDLVISFVDKGGLNDQQNLFEKYKNSRYILIEPMIQNIRNYPYLGIGFGVSSYFDTWNPSYDSLLNIPISAVTEKGNFFLAVFEEIGLVGSIFFLIVLLNLTYTSLKASYEKSFIFLLILVINLSEYFLFSMGGIGLVSAVFLTYSISYPKL